MTTSARAETTDVLRQSPDELIAHGITPLSQEEIAAAARIGELAAGLAGPVDYLLATPGKNLRSMMVLQCANVGPQPANPSVRTGAIAVELGHLATLAHDDVVDDASVRRGADAVGVVYGSFASGFAGGTLFARAGELIAGCGAESTRRFARMAEEVGSGQMMEFEDLFNLSRTAQSYHLAIKRKTASLFGLSAWLGASLAGADEETAEALARFGREFGVAFQLADDILDLVAPQSETGKVRGKDLQQGVYTLAVIHALEKEDRLRAALAREVHSAALPDLLARIERSGGIEHATNECVRWANRARATLGDELGLAPAAPRERLGILLDLVLTRIPHLRAAEVNENGRRH